MWVTKKRLYERTLELEKQLESERERHLAREDALLNRVLSRAGAFPITSEEVTGEKEKPPPPAEPAGLTDVRASFMEWANEAGVSDFEARQQWELHKDAYSEALQ